MMDVDGKQQQKAADKAHGSSTAAEGMQTIPHQLWQRQQAVCCCWW